MLTSVGSCCFNCCQVMTIHNFASKPLPSPLSTSMEASSPSLTEGRKGETKVWRTKDQPSPARQLHVTQQHVLSGHSASISCLSVAPTGFIASGSHDNTVRCAQFIRIFLSLTAFGPPTTRAVLTFFVSLLLNAWRGKSVGIAWYIPNACTHHWWRQRNVVKEYVQR